MLRVNFPANSLKVHEQITEIVTFQTIPTDPLDYLIYGLTEAHRVAYNVHFALTGHDSNLFILSIGFVWYYLTFLLLVLLVK